MEQHNEVVSLISTQVRQFHDSKTSFRIYHGSTLSTRPTAKTKSNTVDISSLNHVLSVSGDSKTCLVEPNVPMDALVAATMEKGFLPPVVMELPNITAGGGFAGTSGESSSFKYGTFDCIVRSIEAVLGDGDIVTARADDAETRDLLYGSAGACGTLGIVTLLEIELIESEPYVELTYHPVHSVESALSTLQSAEEDPSIDFIDGILFSPSSGTVMTGKLTTCLPATHHNLQTFHNPSDPWFYLHAQSITTTYPDPSSLYKEYIPTPSYLFRYDRAVFWSGALAFSYFHFPFNFITRRLLDPFMRTRVVNHALHRSGLARRGIIQDLGLPYNTASQFIAYVEKKLGFWPLWLCPVKSPAALGRASFSMGNESLELPSMMLDVGVWGIGPSDDLQFIKLNREIEGVVSGLGGVKCLYAHAYYTEEEFWRIYDEAGYKAARAKWRAEGLPSVFDKVRVDLKGVDLQGGWAMGRIWGVYGVMSAVKMMLFGGDFVLKRR
ncbi:24-dehydrocholesterol reductase-like protein precursor [Lojkania enalia]|uniref:Delta(24)-sterol reductase n=1 Tax=Lojkania enalia TaxID=147567 RepID=A0A9P4K330_9PLEO|nr:24-dehydrocholesterol reductase-like protein precursor [Didymosphaeria enalia]